MGRWEKFWLTLIVTNLLITFLLPFWPGVEWPKAAFVTGGAALLGMVSIAAFFWAYYRARV